MWRSAPGGQEYQPNTMLFEALVNMADKMDFYFYL